MSSANSYRQILKASSIMGGSAAMSMLIGMVKTKFAAILIGTAGIGLVASFAAIQGPIATIAGLGIGSSGVRDVASAVAKGDQQAIGRAVLTLRRMCWLTGILGMLIVAALSPVIGQITFGSDIYNLEIASLGLIILFSNISGGQMAFIQGSRRIGDIARVNISSAIIAAIITIALYYYQGLRGIVPALVISAAIQILISWRYARRLPVPYVNMSWRESFREAGTMVKLGIAMMCNGLLGSLVNYLTVTIISQQFGIQSVGIYSAAFALSGVFVNFVLNAMGSDYYPRLVGVAHDKNMMNKMVNEQTEIGLLLAMPGILFTLIMAPWVIDVFYSKEFIPAIGMLKWFILGCLGQVISWPLGFVMVALGKGNWFIFSETLGNLLKVSLIVGLAYYFGFEGIAMAFPVLYVFYILLVLIIANQLTGFIWSVEVAIMLLVSVLSAIVVMYSVSYLESIRAIAVGGFILFVFSIYSARNLIDRVGVEHGFVDKLLKIPGMCLVIGVKK